MKNIVLGIILFSSTSYVVAQDLALASDQRGWIVGAGIGTAMLSIKPEKQPGYVSSKENTSLFTVFGGYNYTNWFGIEFDISRSSDFKDENTKLDAYIFGTSFTPKFTYHFKNNLDVYFKTGLQYIAYEQSVNSVYTNEITWDGIATLFGTGLQYSFDSGVRARIDYKYSKLNLERSGTSIFGFNLYDEQIDLTFNALTFTVNYQF